MSSVKSYVSRSMPGLNVLLLCVYTFIKPVAIVPVIIWRNQSIVMPYAPAAAIQLNGW
jgi:hypothetical protein